jgi:hypothetical protein
VTDQSWERWHERQEKEKVTKYKDVCSRLGWSFVPLILDCFGGIGDEGRIFLGTCIRAILGQKEPWERRSCEAECWQGLSIVLAREVGRQLSWAQCLGSEDMQSPVLAHQPYNLD